MYHGELADADGESLSTYFYDLPTTAKRRNAYVHPSSAKAGDLRIFALPDLIEANGLGSGPGAFVYPGECARLTWGGTIDWTSIKSCRGRAVSAGASHDIRHR